MTRLILTFLLVIFFISCKKTHELQTQTNDVLKETVIDSVAVWDTFRKQIIENDPDFDMLKHYNPDKVSAEIAYTILEDDYTKSVLAKTTFDQLENEILDGINAKALYVLIASDDITIGTIYYFQFTFEGIQLIGTMPY